jgi:hypothetical protein
MQTSVYSMDHGSTESSDVHTSLPAPLHVRAVELDLLRYMRIP